MSETKLCKKCDKEFVPSKGLINYCSMQCRNSKTFSQESKARKSYKQIKFLKSLVDNDRQKYFNNLKNNITKNQEKLKSARNNKFKNKLGMIPFDKLSHVRRRTKVIEDQNYRCKLCGLSEWMGHLINLEMDHIDGNNSNNLRENLRALCPNCHSNTPTWRGRNIKRYKHVVADDDILSTIKSEKSIKRALLKVGLMPTKDNYNRAWSLLSNHPTHTSQKSNDNASENILKIKPDGLQLELELFRSSIDNLANYYGVSSSTIKHWCNEYNIDWMTITGYERVYSNKFKSGTENPNNILSENDVKFIKANCIPRHKVYGCRPLAQRFNVNHSVVSDIINGKTWRHVT